MVTAVTAVPAWRGCGHSLSTTLCSVLFVDISGIALFSVHHRKRPKTKIMSIVRQSMKGSRSNCCGSAWWPHQPVSHQWPACLQWPANITCAFLSCPPLSRVESATNWDMAVNLCWVDLWPTSRWIIAINKVYMVLICGGGGAGGSGASGLGHGHRYPPGDESRGVCVKKLHPLYLAVWVSAVRCLVM